MLYNNKYKILLIFITKIFYNDLEEILRVNILIFFNIKLRAILNYRNEFI